MKCKKCQGKGYVQRTVKEGNQLNQVKVWCENCKGTGIEKYDGDRTGMEWERE